MPKVKEMSSEQQQLFAELKKLSKRANQRIVRLEREFRKRYLGYKKIKRQACSRTATSLD